MVTQRQYETDAFESADQKYDLMGTLKDDDGNPLSQVDLAIKCEDDGTEYSATTDSDGKFLLENVGPGKYTVTVNSEDYDETSEEHVVGGDSSSQEDSESDKSSSDENEETQSSGESTNEGSDESSNDSETESAKDDDDDGNDDDDKEN